MISFVWHSGEGRPEEEEEEAGRPCLRVRWGWHRGWGWEKKNEKSIRTRERERESEKKEEEKKARMKKMKVGYGTRGCVVLLFIIIHVGVIIACEFYLPVQTIHVWRKLQRVIYQQKLTWQFFHQKNIFIQCWTICINTWFKIDNNHMTSSNKTKNIFLFAFEIKRIMGKIWNKITVDCFGIDLRIVFSILYIFFVGERGK